jgi:hypothetical protein
LPCGALCVAVAGCDVGGGAGARSDRLIAMGSQKDTNNDDVRDPWKEVQLLELSLGAGGRALIGTGRGGGGTEMCTRATRCCSQHHSQYCRTPTLPMLTLDVRIRLPLAKPLLSPEPNKLRLGGRSHSCSAEAKAAPTMWCSGRQRHRRREVPQEQRLFPPPLLPPSVLPLPFAPLPFTQSPTMHFKLRSLLYDAFTAVATFQSSKTAGEHVNVRTVHKNEGGMALTDGNQRGRHPKRLGPAQMSIF